MITRCRGPKPSDVSKSFVKCGVFQFLGVSVGLFRPSFPFTSDHLQPVGEFSLVGSHEELACGNFGQFHADGVGQTRERLRLDWDLGGWSRWSKFGSGCRRRLGDELAWLTLGAKLCSRTRLAGLGGDRFTVRLESSASGHDLVPARCDGVLQQADVHQRQTLFRPAPGLASAIRFRPVEDQRGLLHRLADRRLGSRSKALCSLCGRGGGRRGRLSWTPRERLPGDWFSCPTGPNRSTAPRSPQPPPGSRRAAAGESAAAGSPEGQWEPVPAGSPEGRWEPAAAGSPEGRLGASGGDWPPMTVSDCWPPRPPGRS